MPALSVYFCVALRFASKYHLGKTYALHIIKNTVEILFFFGLFGKAA